MTNDRYADPVKTQIAYIADGGTRICWGGPGIAAERLAATLPADTAWREISEDEARALLETTTTTTTTTIDDVKAEAHRRIDAAIPRWMIDRQSLNGTPVPQGLKDYAQAVREASDRIEAMEPIPAEYAEDGYWPDRPFG